MGAARTSAGILLHGTAEDGSVVVFLAHFGGPFWARRDDGAWAIPKGEYDPAVEDPRAAAAREFAEEIGIPVPPGPSQDLGEHVQRGGKRVRAFAVRVDDPATVAFVASNTVHIQWPRGSGRLLEFPEVDRAEWFDLATARRRILPSQAPLLDALQRSLGQ